MATEMELFRNIPLFKTLVASSLKEIQKLLKKEHYKKGKRIIKEGESGDSLFIILEGEVEVVKGKGKNSRQVASLKAFDFFGEMSLLENKPRSATIIAKKDSVLLKLNKTNFEKLVNKFPIISFRIMKTLSARIRETDRRLIDDLKKKNKELRKTYRDLENVQEELIKAERLSTIGRVAGGIIHDLKNHLSVVKGYAEYIKYSEDATEPFINAASTMLHVINIILKMAQEVLEFSKGTYKLETIPLKIDTLLREVAAISSKDLEKRTINLNLQLAAHCSCEIDPQKMRRVFVNIISNASDAMQDGGTLTISSAKENKSVTVSFKDTGIGIDKETLKEIFEPFISKGKTKGIGLGMSIAKRFVEDHKGTIDVTSSVGKGTTVTIILPAL